MCPRNMKQLLHEHCGCRKDLETLHIRSEHLVEFYRAHLQEVVAIHRAMFQKLLFEEASPVDADLAELFQDVGKTYLKIADGIRKSCLSAHSLQD